MFLDNFKLSSCNYMLFFAFLEADIGFWYSNIISAAIHAAIIYIFKKLKIRGTFSLFIIFSQNQFPLLYRPIGDKQITSATMTRGYIELKKKESEKVNKFHSNFFTKILNASNMFCCQGSPHFSYRTIKIGFTEVKMVCLKMGLQRTFGRSGGESKISEKKEHPFGIPS